LLFIYRRSLLENTNKYFCRTDGHQSECGTVRSLSTRLGRLFYFLDVTGFWYENETDARDSTVRRRRWRSEARDGTGVSLIRKGRGRKQVWNADAVRPPSRSAETNKRSASRWGGRRASRDEQRRQTTAPHVPRRRADQKKKMEKNTDVASSGKDILFAVYTGVPLTPGTRSTGRRCGATVNIGTFVVCMVDWIQRFGIDGKFPAETIFDSVILAKSFRKCLSRCIPYPVRLESTGNGRVNIIITVSGAKKNRHPSEIRHRRTTRVNAPKTRVDAPKRDHTMKSRAPCN